MRTEGELMIPELYINLKEFSEVEWMNGDFLFKDAWLRLIDWLHRVIMN